MKSHCKLIIRKWQNQSNSPIQVNLSVNVGGNVLGFQGELGSDSDFLNWADNSTILKFTILFATWVYLHIS